MNQLGRFFSPRDLKVISSFNQELIGDIIQTNVTIFKVCPTETKINIYGESDPNSGKFFYSGIPCTCYIDKADIDTTYDQFGSDRFQTIVFKFLRSDLEIIKLYPESGDFFQYNAMYFEADNITEQQFLGGQPTKSWSIIVNSHYTRLSKISLVERQV